MKGLNLHSRNVQVIRATRKSPIKGGTEAQDIMFIVDFITAFLLAVAFTIAFAVFMRKGGHGRWRKMSATIWLLVVASWIAGMALVGFGAMATHGLPFVSATVAMAIVITLLMSAGRLRRTVSRRAGDESHHSGGAIALYFCVTLLLYFCAISLRVYIVNLS